MRKSKKSLTSRLVRTSEPCRSGNRSFGCISLTKTSRHLEYEKSSTAGSFEKWSDWATSMDGNRRRVRLPHGWPHPQHVKRRGQGDEAIHLRLTKGLNTSGRPTRARRRAGRYPA